MTYMNKATTKRRHALHLGEKFLSQRNSYVAISSGAIERPHPRPVVSLAAVVGRFRFVAPEAVSFGAV